MSRRASRRCNRETQRDLRWEFQYLPMYTFESALHASRRYVSPAKYQ